MPGAEEDADCPLGRQRLPEAPEMRPLALFVGGLGEAVRQHVPRIHPVVQLVDRLALARAFDAGDEDEHREAAVLLEIVLGVQEPLA